MLQVITYFLWNAAKNYTALCNLQVQQYPPTLSTPNLNITKTIW